jgi:hypothetical protein
MSKNRNKYATCEWFGLVVCRKQLEYENSSREDQIEMLENKLKVGTAHVYVATHSAETVAYQFLSMINDYLPQLPSILMFTTFYPFLEIIGCFLCRRYGAFLSKNA